MKKKKYILLYILTLICFFDAFAQNQEDRHARNKRIADSLYYVHTIKPREDSIRQARLMETASKHQQMQDNDENTFASKSKKKKGDNKKLVSHTNSTNSEKNLSVLNTKKRISQANIPTTSTNATADTSKRKNCTKVPCTTLYQNTWFSERVKSEKVSLKDIPDEVTLKLCGKNSTDKFVFPCKGIKTSGYGWRWGRPHTGIDIALRTGDKIYAAFDGVVRVAKYNGGYGNMVLIRHYNNLETLYGHMSEIKVKVGQEVKAGDVIGLGGSTGRSTGPHLHFECRLLYACFDPEWIVDIKNFDLKTKLIRIDKSYFGTSASQAAYDKKESVTKLTKVNTLLDGTKYISDKELNKLIAKKEKEMNQPVKINNDDKSTWRYYRIKEDDTLEGISLKYRVTIEDLVKMNNLKDNNLTVGAKIRIR